MNSPKDPLQKEERLQHVLRHKDGVTLMYDTLTLPL